jgi:methanogenic corrinoid protein MtbC1
MVPLIQEIGDRWQLGTLKVAHEHIATAVIRTFLGNFARSYALPSSAPGLIVTTPSGQLHELGAILVAAAANNQGWRVTYLGPSLPAEEIAGAVLQDAARAVALSIVYPEDDPHLQSELRKLRKLLPADTALLVGGRVAHCYHDCLREIGAIELPDIQDLHASLERLRKTARRQQ